ncbi:MAG: pyruvate, phosphate dikinase [Lentisphaerae bacterium]|nr:pyruvate, phosphate dikinase [Lentisphaerota bacterium]
MLGDDGRLSTGIRGLDHVLKGLLAGDNIVWQVDDVGDYRAVVEPYVREAVRVGHKVVYFRFSAHEPLVMAQEGVRICECRPADGFENTIERIHGVIEESGLGAFYVFDCLSDLALAWHSDQMLANFFMLTCPYLFDLETITYFALLRNYHSPYATRPISETTQLLLDLYRHDEHLYVRPLKVQHRYSPTMNLLHRCDGDELTPVTASSDISEILTSARWSGLHTDQIPGFWDKAFIEAQKVHDQVKAGVAPEDEENRLFGRLSSMVFSRDPGMAALASKYLCIEDMFDVRRRMIGTGLIGGKTVGMLLARAILKKRLPRMKKLLEEHDSFYVGSDVFYTFLVRNGIWWARQQQRDPERFLEGAVRSRRRMLTGTFPDYTVREFEEMLDYFGQSPFIVRSSSLLEDNYGNAFAGKYDSVFCANQGPRERRLEDFLAAVRAIYASSMSERALSYRAKRGLLEQDEQMALLIMRVSGDMHGRSYYPAVAGVGYSYNPYVWNSDIDPEAGVLRLVFGLGTRAVDRADDDYTRIVALNAPELRPEGDFEEVRQFAQRRVDYLDLSANQLVSGYFVDLVKERGDLPMELFASSDRRSGGAPVLTFDRLLADTGFVADLREMLSVLSTAYSHPVDIEFTGNFSSDGAYRINLVQCRPLQVRGTGSGAVPEVKVPPGKFVASAAGAVIGPSRVLDVGRFVYVSPDAYGALPVSERYEVARLIGAINAVRTPPPPENIVLIGPGRWGTRSPSLGIPVVFNEIHGAAALCEVVAMHDGLVPDVSLGTHFLSDLVEMDMLYLALFPGKKDNLLNGEFFEKAPNRLAELLPGSAKWSPVVKIVDASTLGCRIVLVADSYAQRAHFYLV